MQHGAELAGAVLSDSLSLIDNIGVEEVIIQHTTTTNLKPMYK